MLIYRSSKQEINYSPLYSLYHVYQIARFDSSQIHTLGSMVIVYSIFLLMIDHYLEILDLDITINYEIFSFRRLCSWQKNIHYLLFYVYHSIGSKEAPQEEQRSRKDAQHHVSFFFVQMIFFTNNNMIYNAEICLQRIHGLSFVVICSLLTLRHRENVSEQNRNSSQMRFYFCLFKLPNIIKHFTLCLLCLHWKV